MDSSFFYILRHRCAIHHYYNLWMIRDPVTFFKACAGTCPVHAVERLPHWSCFFTIWCSQEFPQFFCIKKWLNIIKNLQVWGTSDGDTTHSEILRPSACILHRHKNSSSPENNRRVARPCFWCWSKAWHPEQTSESWQSHLPWCLLRAIPTWVAVPEWIW